MALNFVQHNFNQAADTYLDHALLQKHCAQKLLTSIAAYHRSGWLLDLGSGPGTLQHQKSALHQATVCYDISLPMLVKAKQQGANVTVNGDAKRLPFAAQSVQTVISNLMLQWPDDKAAIFAEIDRVLVPEGHVIFTTFLAPSLWQLQTAWASIDNASHTLTFLALMDYQALCQNAGLTVLHLEQWQHDRRFTDMNALFRHFKATGTALPKAAHRQGLGGKKALETLALAYPGAMTESDLILSYYPLLVIAKKSRLYD